MDKNKVLREFLEDYDFKTISELKEVLVSDILMNIEDYTEFIMSSKNPIEIITYMEKLEKQFILYKYIVL